MEVKELKFVKDVVVKTAEAVMAEKGKKIEYMVGTMIEIPKAVVLMKSKEAGFFSLRY